ncbi:hypothetical protein [Bradyrhizobium lablabi]|uniref:hypothetical protein n=1 Tax=Bradyrhizobium lablabi TaxID=722472 RepID=UPI001BAD5EBE|nr:hypothetical protein [Bradyrhizobium lablabi]MBR0696714.1 hypothetical protein [Bradyrhizobium lablabi]
MACLFLHLGEPEATSGTLTLLGDCPTLIDELLTGQYDHVLRIVAFNPAEAWARDASAEVAHDLEWRIVAEGLEVSDALRDFIESYLGRPIGAQLALPPKDSQRTEFRSLTQCQRCTGFG